MLRRALTVLLALVFVLQGSLALARPDCHHASKDLAGGASAPMPLATSSEDISPGDAPVGGASAPMLFATSSEEISTAEIPVGGASAPMLLADSAVDPHAAHRATHDHGATDSSSSTTSDGCSDDCRCQGHCATSGASAISADPGSRVAVQPTDAPELSRTVAQPGVAPARRLRPPIEA
jgi:hypothetical protein